MNRVPPSERIGESIAKLLNQGIEGDGSVVGELMRLGAQKFVQELVEREVTSFLGRDHYARRENGDDLRGYRNGYRPKSMNTAEGALPVQMPQVQGSVERFHSHVVEFLEGNTDVLERMVAEMYVRGLSTRDIEDALRDATGERLLTRTDVSAITESLWAEYLSFRDRRLDDFDVVYLFLDAISSRCAAPGPSRTASWSPGGSFVTADECCCTWRWGAVRAWRIGLNSCGTWSGAASRYR